jgi:heme O synthase-like polyprenyltransferase
MLSTVIAEASSNDVNVLFLILALAAFAVAIWLTTVSNYIGAIVAAVIGVIILVFAF